MRLQNTHPSATAFILIAFSIAVNTSFIGTLRLSPFFAYAARTVGMRQRKSTSSHVRGRGDGDTSPDAVVQGDKILLRAERHRGKR